MAISKRLRDLLQLPTIDIDVLDGFRFYKPDNYPNSCEQNVMKLYAGTQPELQAPKTLDHYYQNELDRERLDELNQEQVFTRYLRWFHERRQAVATPHFWRGLWGQFKTADQPQQPGQPQSSMNQTTAITKTAIRLAERRQSHRSFQEASKLERQSSQDNQTRLADTGTQAEQEDQTDWSQPHTDRIMVVSQLWLFRSDSKCPEHDFLVCLKVANGGIAERCDCNALSTTSKHPGLETGTPTARSDPEAVQWNRKASCPVS